MYWYHCFFSSSSFFLLFFLLSLSLSLSVLSDTWKESYAKKYSSTDINIAILCWVTHLEQCVCVCARVCVCVHNNILLIEFTRLILGKRSPHFTSRIETFTGSLLHLLFKLLMLIRGNVLHMIFQVRWRSFSVPKSVNVMPLESAWMSCLVVDGRMWVFVVENVRLYQYKRITK